MFITLAVPYCRLMPTDISEYIPPINNPPNNMLRNSVIILTQTPKSDYFCLQATRRRTESGWYTVTIGVKPPGSL
jgi:hypothetical protein